MKRLNYSIFIVTLLSFYGCKEQGRLDIEMTDGPVPALIGDVTVTPRPGGALLKYRIPNDKNISYVKARYEIQPGVFQEGKSSIYSDTLVLEGFGDTLQHAVSLFSVGKNERHSEPLTIQVKSLLPSVQSSFKTLSLERAFGGVRVRFENDNRANLSIVLLSDTANDGYWTSLQTFYTKAREGNFSYRGLPPVQRKFAVYLRDRWNNKSDTLSAELTPLFEEVIPKPFAPLHLPTDEYLEVEPIFPMSNLWDNDLGTIFASRHNTVLPQWFTVDLRVPAVISRIKEHQRRATYTYTGSNVKSFELWGSSNPNPDGSWDSWHLLGTFNSYKPSGLPLGSVSAEDLQYAWADGEDFELEDVPPPYRYIRFKTTATYGGGSQITIAELQFFGQIQR